MHKPLEIVRRGFPITSWLLTYTAQNAVCDLIAGITVGLTLIPQSIAYAALAGLGPEFGLYSSLVGGVIYVLFGTVTDLNIAPTALISLLTYSYTNNVSFGVVPAAILLCFLSGVIEIFCGLLHLGFLVDFVSMPVVAGFTSAGALTIAAAQFKNVLGLNFKAESFALVVYNVFVHIGETKIPDALLSLGCCMFLISLREVKRFGNPPAFGKSSKDNDQSSWKTAIWFLSVARNAIVVIFCAAMAFILGSFDMKPFSLTGTVPQGLPPVYVPFMPNNGTEYFNFFDCASQLGTGIIVVPLISILSNIAIAKSFAGGKVLDASQEMLALGCCNFFGSFFGSYPINASFSRAAVNNASGARTPLGGIYAGALVVLSLTLLTPYFSYIPKPTLSSVIICAVIYMVEVNLTKLVWKINKIDFIPLFFTLVACLCLSIEIGILLGILVDLLLVMYFTARPKIEIDYLKHNSNRMYLKVTLVGFLFYSAAEYAREKVMQEYQQIGDSIKYVAFDCTKLRKLDFTAAKCMDSLVRDINKHETKIAFVELKPSLKKLMEKTLTAQVIFLQSHLELDSFFGERDEKPLNGPELNAAINLAYEPDDGVTMK